MPYEYQKGFYQLSEGVRDQRARLRKAQKIAYLLQTLTEARLSTATCLDIGCSSGVITAALAPFFARVVGLEYDGVALQQVARPTSPPTHFVQGDAMDVPIAAGAVDMIVCAQVYEHVPDDLRLFDEMFRVLKPGGIIFFSGPNKLFPIEPHYGLPCLHWLSARWADAYLSVSRKGNHYYERSRTFWDLRRRLAQFTLRDMTPEVLKREVPGITLKWIISHFPAWGWKWLAPLWPNFNWILYKPEADDN